MMGLSLEEKNTCSFRVGEKYLIRSVTFYYTGRVKTITDTDLVRQHCSSAGPVCLTFAIRAPSARASIMGLREVSDIRSLAIGDRLAGGSDIGDRCLGADRAPSGKEFLIRLQPTESSPHKSTSQAPRSRIGPYEKPIPPLALGLRRSFVECGRKLE